MNDQNDPYDLNYTNDWEPTEDEEKLLDELGIHGAARRQFLGKSIAGGLGLFALTLLAKEKALASVPASSEAVFAQTPSIENAVKVVLKINGSAKNLEVDSRTVLLDALRENLALTGTKKRLRSRTVRRVHRDRGRLPRAFVPDADRELPR